MNIVSVGAGKGGVGKSTVLANLGILLAQDGYKVLMVDADPLAKLSCALGVMGGYGFEEYMRGRRTFAEIVSRRYGEFYDPGARKKKEYSVSLVSGSSEVLNFNPGEKEANALLDGLRKYDKADVCLIDLPAGLGAYHRKLMHASNDVILVLNPTPAARSDAVKTLNAHGRANLARSLDPVTEKYRLEDIAVALINMKKYETRDEKGEEVSYTKPLHEILTGMYHFYVKAVGLDNAVKEFSRPLEVLTEGNPYGEKISREYYESIYEAVIGSALKKGKRLRNVWESFLNVGHSRTLLAPIFNGLGSDDDMELWHTDKNMFASEIERLNEETYDALSGVLKKYYGDKNHEYLPMFCIDRLGMLPEQAFRLARKNRRSAFYSEESVKDMVKRSLDASVPLLILGNREEQTVVGIAESLGLNNGYIGGALAASIGDARSNIERLKHAYASQHCLRCEDVVEHFARDPKYDAGKRGKDAYLDHFVDVYRFLDAFGTSLSCDNTVQPWLFKPDRSAVHEEIRRITESQNSVPVKLVVNMADNLLEARAQRKLIRSSISDTTQSVAYLGGILKDDKLCHGDKLGDRPIVESSPKSIAAKNFRFFKRQFEKSVLGRQVAVNDAVEEKAFESLKDRLKQYVASFWKAIYTK